jgi:cell division protein FtsA
LSDDDKEYGCALVNIGEEITSLMIFGRGAVQHTMVFPFGGMHFTKDIAVGLRVSILKPNGSNIITDASAGFLMSAEERQGIIEVTPVGRQETRQLSKEILCDIMQPRAVELLQHIAHEVFGIRGQISSGVVFDWRRFFKPRNGRNCRTGFRRARHDSVFWNKNTSADCSTKCKVPIGRRLAGWH